MSFDYTTLRRETVEPLIEEFGKSGTLLVAGTDVGGILVDRNGDPILDRDGNQIVTRDLSPSNPWESQLGFDVSYAVTLVQTRFKKADNRGTIVETDDVLYLVSTKNVTIDPGLADRITVGAVTYQVVRIDPLVPGPVVMFWYLHARK